MLLVCTAVSSAQPGCCCGSAPFPVLCVAAQQHAHCSLSYCPGSSASPGPAQCDGFAPFRGGWPRCAQASPTRCSLPGGPSLRQKPRPALTSFLLPSQALPFSHLILATGSTGLFPGKFNEVSSREAAIQAYEDMVKQVSCLLAGWGCEGQAGPGERGTTVGMRGVAARRPPWMQPRRWRVSRTRLPGRDLCPRH